MRIVRLANFVTGSSGGLRTALRQLGAGYAEALASGTPVVVRTESALPEVVGGAGLAAPGEGPAYAEAVLDLAVRPRAYRRAAARRRAERYPWSAAVAGFLAAHGAAAHGGAAADNAADAHADASRRSTLDAAPRR